MTARHTHAAAPVLAVLALALTGCTTAGTDAKPTATTAPATTTAAPTTTPADPQSAEKAAILGAFGSMWTEQMKAYRQRSVKGTDLEKYATFDALGETRITVTRMTQAGTQIQGEPRYDGATVSMLDLTAKTPKAVITACTDLSGYRMTKAGKPVPLPTNQPLRYLMTVSAEKWPNGWMITRINREGSRSC
ncbi:hypothetical protein ABZV60_19775 [Streptomyces sp. NPDC004787]|uniref:hypothetical protein n=1 Tax=Streptomyces sp. NPDC004787 TaxID=3154291 RepID=UPI0033A4BA06